MGPGHNFISYIFRKELLNICSTQNVVISAQPFQIGLREHDTEWQRREV